MEQRGAQRSCKTSLRGEQARKAYLILAHWTWELFFIVQQVNALEITPDRRHVAVAGHGVVRFFDTSAVSMTPVGFLGTENMRG